MGHSGTQGGHSGTTAPNVWVDISDTVDTKVAALMEHKSQVGDDPERLAELMKQRIKEPARRSWARQGLPRRWSPRHRARWRRSGTSSCGRVATRLAGSPLSSERRVRGENDGRGANPTRSCDPSTSSGRTVCFPPRIGVCGRLFTGTTERVHRGGSHGPAGHSEPDPGDGQCRLHEHRVVAVPRRRRWWRPSRGGCRKRATWGRPAPSVLASGRGMRQELRESLAAFLNVSTEELTLTQNTTEGQNLVINGLAWQQGDEVITFSLEHNSVLAPCYYLERRHGTVTKVLPLAPDEDHDSIVSKVEAAITPRTKLLFMSHVQFKSGLRMPAERLREVTRQHGVLMLLDGAQGAGHVQLDLHALGCDFYAMPGHKWMLGPDGTGALYIRRELIEQVTPMKVSGSRDPLGPRLGGLRAERVRHPEAGAHHHERRPVGGSSRGHPLPRATPPGGGGGAQPLAGVSGEGGAGGGAGRVDHVAAGRTGVLRAGDVRRRRLGAAGAGERAGVGAQRLDPRGLGPVVRTDVAGVLQHGGRGGRRRGRGAGDGAVGGVDRI